MSRFITHLAYKGDRHTPTIILSDGENFSPVGKTVSLSFSMSERFCVGWHDISIGEDHPCPEQATTTAKFSMCIACQKRTGFNPAFYHADKVSPQQEARNAEPHLLYLAYMGTDYIKVGITWEKRGINRLLEQGARSGILLDTFPSALIARQYEEQIARLHNIHETTLTRVKLDLLNKPYSPDTATEDLLTTKQHIEQSLSVTFSGSEVLHFDEVYSSSKILNLQEITALSGPEISGTVEAFIGDILIARYENRRVALPLKQYIGYPVEISDGLRPLDLEPQQMMLF